MRAAARSMRLCTSPIDALVHCQDETAACLTRMKSETLPPYSATSTAAPPVMRGSELYVTRESVIAEIRAYFLHDDLRDTELTGFPYPDRGYLLHPK